MASCFQIEIWASRDEQQFLRERAATSLHFISKQAIREHAILSPPVFVDRVCLARLSHFLSFSLMTRAFCSFHSKESLLIIYYI